MGRLLDVDAELELNSKSRMLPVRWGAGAMRIDAIYRREELDALKQNWDDLYRADPEAQYFLSWQFISAFFRRFEGQWFVLAASQDARPSPYVALMPLRLKTRMNGKAGFFYHDVMTGGSYVADYTGAVCAPEFAQAAMAGFGRHLRKMHWANLHLENLRMSGGRLKAFLDRLEDKPLEIRHLSRVNKPENVDNSRCPSVELPETWDAYLEQQLGSNMRQKLRRLLRKLDGSDEFRVTLPDAASIDRDIAILLDLWKNRWGARKGDSLRGILNTNRRVFGDAFANGSLFLPVLWHRDRPIGALATFVDPVKKTYFFSMAGRDETADILPPGLVPHAYSIRHAIQNGYRTYDFLRGDEPYKYSFGASDTIIASKLVRTRSRRNLGDRLDARALTGIFRVANRNHKNGHLAKAENAYRQILDTDPAHAPTLYALGQLLASKGDQVADGYRAANGQMLGQAGNGAAGARPAHRCRRRVWQGDRTGARSRDRALRPGRQPAQARADGRGDDCAECRAAAGFRKPEGGTGAGQGCATARRRQASRCAECRCSGEEGRYVRAQAVRRLRRPGAPAASRAGRSTDRRSLIRPAPRRSQCASAT
jgi:CelD/BcsL family acetyltransferase involved in cellulose biosynthesis